MAVEIFFYGKGGWGCCVKMSAAMVDQGRKIKKKHWLKRPKAIHKKGNLDQNKKDSKSHICNSFFENIFSGVQL